jgi:hypothetical protein
LFPNTSGAVVLARQRLINSLAANSGNSELHDLYFRMSVFVPHDTYAVCHHFLFTKKIVSAAPKRAATDDVQSTNTS